MMLRTEDLKAYSIHLPLDFKGTICDMYFDDLLWKIQYILILNEENVDVNLFLISHLILGKPDNKSESIPVSYKLDKKEILRRTHLPETDSGIHNRMSPFVFDLSPRQLNIKSLSAKEVKNSITDILVNEYNLPPPSIGHLRSRNNVLGYNIQVKNGDLVGHIEDLIVETNTWKVRYLLVDTRNWITRGKKILMSPAWIEKIWWSGNLVSIDLKKETIVHSPAYNSEDPLDDELELKLFEYYVHQYYSSSLK